MEAPPEGGQRIEEHNEGIEAARAGKFSKRPLSCRALGAQRRAPPERRGFIKSPLLPGYVDGRKRTSRKDVRNSLDQKVTLGEARTSLHSLDGPGRCCLNTAPNSSSKEDENSRQRPARNLNHRHQKPIPRRHEHEHPSMVGKSPWAG